MLPLAVYDVDGEEPHTGIVAGITPGSSTLVTTVEDERLEFQEGVAGVAGGCIQSGDVYRRGLLRTCPGGYGG